ncbi:MAG: trimethylamine methyltransferase family protein [Alphaproteobacteria bacterium]
MTRTPAAGRRRRQDARPTGLTVRQLPARRLRHQWEPMRVLSDDQIEDIHRASLRVLKETGVEVMDPEACRILHEAGCDVNHTTGRVRFEADFIETQIAKAPSSWTHRARNPERSVEIGGPNLVFSPVGGPAFMSTLDIPRRRGTHAECQDFLRLTQHLNILHRAGSGFVPHDLPAETRGYDLMLDSIILADKPMYGGAFGRADARRGIEMAAIAFGESEEAFCRHTNVDGVVNMNSPLRLDKEMSQGLITLARHNQTVIFTPFTLAGAMCPVSLEGALVQQNAEALMGIALVQTVRAGSPVMYGAFTSNVDMRTGAPAFGTPEYTRTTIASGQLTRRYGVPYRSSNVTASNAPDAQAAYEAEMSLWGIILGRVNFVLHAAGWLEGGLTASFEKLILDAEMLQMVAEFMKPFDTSEENLGVEAIAGVGPGGHFFGSPHTIQRYNTAFYEPMVSDWRNFENWSEDGALTATQRANAIWKQMLKDYEQPPLDPAIREELEAYVARGKEAVKSAA